MYDEPMARHTSLGVGGKADALVFVENETQLADLVGILKDKNIHFFPAGNLTNVLVRDGGYRGYYGIETSGREGIRATKVVLDRVLFGK